MRKRILELMPVLACLTLVLATAGAAHATFPGTNGRIAFTRQITTDIAGVFTAKPDGSDEQQVPLGGTDGVEIFSGVHWSPDGRELLIDHTLRIDPSTGQCCLPFRPAIVKPDGSDYKHLRDVLYGEHGLRPQPRDGRIACALRPVHVWSEELPRDNVCRLSHRECPALRSF